MNLTKEWFETTLFEIDITRASTPHYMFQHQQKYILSLVVCVCSLAYSVPIRMIIKVFVHVC